MDIERLAPSGSLVEPLLERLERAPAETALVLIEDDDTERRVTVAELHAAALNAARALIGAGAGPGRVVILAQRHSLDLVAALFGAWYCGAVPSLFPYLHPVPDVAKLGGQVERLVAQTRAAAVVTVPDVEAGLTSRLAASGCRVMSGRGLFAGAGAPDAGKRRPSGFLAGEQPAYVQFTSGTTGLQKGVELSHRAVLNCVRALALALAVVDSDVVVNWLPLYHDYGLFAGLMLPVLAGVPTVLLSPFKWVRSPESFLWAIHRHRGTLAWLPNSAYSHTTLNARAERLEGLDLGSLRCLLNGAEPIMYRTQERFRERFAPYGFKETALTTGYGLAENSLAVTISPMGRRADVDWVSAEALRVEGVARPAEPGAPRSLPLVSSGSMVFGVEVRIVDRDDRLLPERSVGEIAIRSRSLFSGYYGRPDLTAEALRGGWFHTGDRGYVAKGQLYVSGRIKDIIIQAGHNIHPEDVEAAAAETPGVDAHRLAAFGVPDETLGTETIVLVCELTNPLDGSSRVALEREVRRRVFVELGIALGEVLFFEGRWIVRTHNGKTVRGACRDKYLAERAANGRTPVNGGR